MHAHEYVVYVALAAVFLFIPTDRSPSPDEPPSRGAATFGEVVSGVPRADPAPIPVQVDIGASEIEKAQAFCDQYLWPVLLHIANKYPVMSVRNEFRRTWDRFQNKEIFIQISHDQGETLGLMAAVENDLGEPGVLIWYPQLVRVLQQLHQVGGGSQAYVDLLVVAWVHEGYHIDHHPRAILGQETMGWSRGDRLKWESEAYWFTAETVIKPMVEAGRFQDLGWSKVGASWGAYKASSTSDDPAWQEFVQGTIPRD